MAWGYYAERGSCAGVTVIAPAETSFRHEALFYAGEDEFLEGTLPLIDEALALEQPVLAAVAPVRISLLREALGARAGWVDFVDMHALGRNPVPIVIPCHRIVREGGDLGGYTGGLNIKRKLLQIEGAL